MATTKKTTATAAATGAAAAALTYAAATAQREAAAQSHAAALGDLDRAHQAQAELRQRLGEGDTSITAADLACAGAVVEHSALLAQGAARTLERAQVTEARLAAEHLAEVLAPIVNPATMDTAQARAVDTISSALTELADVAREQHATLSRALRTAQELGLPPSGAVTLRRDGVSRPGLMISGRPVAPPDVRQVVSQTIAEATMSAGWWMSSTPDLRAVEKPRQGEATTESDNGLMWDEVERLAQKAKARERAERITQLKAQRASA